MNKMVNNQRTSVFFMANLGAEVSRIISAKKNNDFNLVRAALDRAIEIIKKIKSLPDMVRRVGEIEKLQETIEDISKPRPVLNISEYGIKSYFLPFAMRLIA